MQPKRETIECWNYPSLPLFTKNNGVLNVIGDEGERAPTNRELMQFARLQIDLERFSNL